jgi:hypothetical protein
MDTIATVDLSLVAGGVHFHRGHGVGRTGLLHQL